MDGLTDELRDFIDAHRIGVLATIAGDGMPRQSVVYYAHDGERLLISTESKRLKARDVVRSGWASLCVPGHEQPYPSAVFSGSAEILTTDIGPATAAVMQRIAGMDEPPEPQTDEALAAGRAGQRRELPSCQSGSGRVRRRRRRSRAVTATGASAIPLTVPAIVSEG
jgi:PPOX class probable F420-dependent enzyme